MIRHERGMLTITCDIDGCEAREEASPMDLTIFKEFIRDEGWHLKKHKKCICMDCWDAGKR